MNKLLIVLLAVCLVSVHAFIKRDTEAVKNEDFFANMQKQIQDFVGSANKKIGETFNPEKIKKKFTEVVDDFQKAVNNFKATTEVPQN